MLAWMRAFGDLQRIGVESDWKLWRRRFSVSCSNQDWGSRGHNPGQAEDRRRRGKNDDLDAQNAAHAAFATSGP